MVASFIFVVRLNFFKLRVFVLVLERFTFSDKIICILLKRNPKFGVDAGKIKLEILFIRTFDTRNRLPF